MTTSSTGTGDVETRRRGAGRAVGRAATRADLRPHVTGGTRYAGDMGFPNLVHGAILTSTHAHADIEAIDVGEAAEMPGVVATLVGAEIPVNDFGSTYTDQPVLAETRVRHHGDLIAAVAAETRQQAIDAIARIRVDYSPLPAVFDPLVAMEEGAPQIHEIGNVYIRKTIRKGDVDLALAQSDHVFENRYTTQMVEHAALEPYSCVAVWEPDGRLHVYSSLGRITKGRFDLARVLELPLHDVTVTGAYVGGNFGGKNEIRTEPIAALLARKSGRPVRIDTSREDEFSGSTTRHPSIADFTTGVSRDGRLLARRVRFVLDGGAYASWSETTVGKAAILAAGPYEVPNVDVEGVAVYTNKAVAGAMRGFGAPQICFGYESQMDEIARALAIDPIEIRLRNAFREGSLSHTGQTLRAVVLDETLERAAALHGGEGLPA